MDMKKEFKKDYLKMINIEDKQKDQLKYQLVSPKMRITEMEYKINI